MTGGDIGLRAPAGGDIGLRAPAGGDIGLRAPAGGDIGRRAPAGGDVELLAPAGEFATALAAFDAGADAVYLGMNSFSARASAVNFSADDLRNIVRVARARGRKVYVTVNTLLTDAELADATELLATLAAIGPDALIVQDLGVAQLVRDRFPSLALHASTQLVAHNLEGVLALRERGFSRVVLARELSLADIRSIAQRCGCELEVFVHGALCYSVSGLCLFSAMEKERSGNRGRCAYCCRMRYAEDGGAGGFAFSMKDLRLDDRLEQLREAGVASLKIEGRMKNALYVATVTRHYRDLLDGAPERVARADLETVFSRRTTRLYADGYAASGVIDPESLGNLGAMIGTVKRLTRDREGVRWLRFHTARALERHDGIQVPVAGKGRPAGFSIGDMRTALARHNVFAVPAGTDVELRVPDDFEAEEGAPVFCGASNAVKRQFPPATWRPADYPGTVPVDLAVTLGENGVCVSATARAADDVVSATVSSETPLAAAEHPEKTEAAVAKAFSKLGGTDYALGTVRVADAAHRYVPAATLNALRRDLVAQLDGRRATLRQVAADAARTCCVRVADAEKAGAPCGAAETEASAVMPAYGVRQRVEDPTVRPADETVLAIGHAATVEEIAAAAARATAGGGGAVRLALPVFTLEKGYNRLRNRVKALVRAGFGRWETGDLAGLRMLCALGVTDITADWSLYAFNAYARAALRAAGVRGFVRSPEAPACAGGTCSAGTVVRDVAWLGQQSTPLFISLTRPAAADPTHLTGWNGIAVTAFEQDGLWITTKTEPRTFSVPDGVPVRDDFSWTPARDVIQRECRCGERTVS